jgi:hypothetical protein
LVATVIPVARATADASIRGSRQLVVNASGVAPDRRPAIAFVGNHSPLDAHARHPLVAIPIARPAEHRRWRHSSATDASAVGI